MVGVEFHGPAALPVLKGLRDDGILATRAGDNVLRLLPPLVVPKRKVIPAARVPGGGARDGGSRLPVRCPPRGFTADGAEAREGGMRIWHTRFLSRPLVR